MSLPCVAPRHCFVDRGPQESAIFISSWLGDSEWILLSPNLTTTLQFFQGSSATIWKSSSKSLVLKPSNQCASMKKWILTRRFGFEAAPLGMGFIWCPVLLLLFTIWDKDTTFLPSASKETSHCHENVGRNGALTRGKTQRQASSLWSSRLPESWEQSPVLWKEVLL